MTVLSMPPVPPKFTKRDDRPAVKSAESRLYCRLQDLLDTQELTRTDLSKQTGLSQQAIRGLCDNTAKRYDSDTIVVLLDFFGIEIGDLFIKVKR